MCATVSDLRAGLRQSGMGLFSFVPALKRWAMTCRPAGRDFGVRSDKELANRGAGLKVPFDYVQGRLWRTLALGRPVKRLGVYHTEHTSMVQEGTNANR
jgi:hypothetical protein